MSINLIFCHNNEDNMRMRNIDTYLPKLCGITSHIEVNFILQFVELVIAPKAFRQSVIT